MSASMSQPTRASTTLAVVAAALMSMGVVMVFSTTVSLEGASPLLAPLQHPAVRHAAFTLAALLVLLVAACVPYHWFRLRAGAWWQPAVLLLIVAVALCAVVLVPGIGSERNGARRWLTVGPAALGLGFQPSELAKLALVVFLAAYAAAREDRMPSFWRGLAPALAVIGLLAGLVGKEDFGTAVMLAAVGGSVLLAAGARWWQFALCALPGAVGAAWLIMSEPYRVQRLLSFMDIWADPRGRGYHQIQSLQTIASGGWWGLGLGNGVQKYGYLPEARTDFIFAIICEELGMLGGVAVIGLFMVFVWQGWRAMNVARDPFARLLILGATLTIGMQAAMNIAVVTVSIPTKGIALPLVSAGGSGVIFLGALIGMLVNASRRRESPDPS